VLPTLRAEVGNVGEDDQPIAAGTLPRARKQERGRLPCHLCRDRGGPCQAGREGGLFPKVRPILLKSILRPDWPECSNQLKKERLAYLSVCPAWAGGGLPNCGHSEAGQRAVTLTPNAQTVHCSASQPANKQLSKTLTPDLPLMTGSARPARFPHCAGPQPATRPRPPFHSSPDLYHESQ